MDASAASRPSDWLRDPAWHQSRGFVFDSVAKGDHPTINLCEIGREHITCTSTTRMHPPPPWRWAKVDGASGVHRAPMRQGQGEDAWRARACVWC